MWANGPMHVDGCVPCRCAVQVIGVSVAWDTYSSFVFFHLTSATLWGSLLHLTVRGQMGEVRSLRNQVSQIAKHLCLSQEVGSNLGSLLTLTMGKSLSLSVPWFPHL